MSQQSKRLWSQKYLRHSVGLLLLLGLSAGVSVALYRFHLTRTGYCLEQSRYLSDHEYMLAAFPRIAWNFKMDGDYATIDEYLRSHPGCCSVDHHDSVLLENLLGRHHVVVEINYEVKAEHAKVDGTAYYKSYVEVTACGVGGRIYGEGTRSLQTATRYR